MRKLGFNPYHMMEATRNVENDHLALWQEAMNAKFKGQGRPYAGKDFDRMLWNYDVRVLCLPLGEEELGASAFLRKDRCR